MIFTSIVNLAVGRNICKYKDRENSLVENLLFCTFRFDRDFIDHKSYQNNHHQKNSDDKKDYAFPSEKHFYRY